MKETIGIIGLGLMGGPIADRFLGDGYNVIAFDTTPERLERARERGACAAESPRDVADVAATIIASVPNGYASEAITLGETGIIYGRAVRRYIETSTIGLSSARRIAEGLSSRSIDMLDAPVSGGPRAIVAGTLTAMVSGNEAIRHSTREILDVFCSKIFEVGDKPGLAQACKLVNNAISLSILALASEATVFGVLAGLDPAVMIDVVNASSGCSAVTVEKFPASILNRKFNFGASMATGAKDMALFVDDAQQLGAFLQIAPQISRVWEQATQSGNGDRDYTEIIKWFEGPVDVEVGSAQG